jgi:DNA-binding response OmpR family regulator
VAHRPTILAVDDDPTARTFIGKTLAALPANVRLAATCAEFTDLAAAVAADLYLIDVDLPDGDGYQLARSLRHTSFNPIIFLTVHDDDGHKLRALELGAIEYLCKPIHPRELALRIRNIFDSFGKASGTASHLASGALPTAVRRVGDLSLDLLRRRLSDNRGHEIALTASEFETLALLAAAPNTVVTRREIASRLGPQSAARHNPRIVDILIWRLRKKLCRGSGEEHWITTLPSQGYMFVADVAPEGETP